MGLETRNLSRWVKCPGCGHEYREKRGSPRRGGPRLFIRCPSCHRHYPFPGYMDGSGVERPALARARARAAGHGGQPTAPGVSTSAKRAEPAPAVPDAPPAEEPAAVTDAGVLPAELAGGVAAPTLVAPEAQPDPDGGEDAPEVHKRYVPRSVAERMLEAVIHGHGS